MSRTRNLDFLEDAKELKPGDILLCIAPKEADWAQHLIMYFQGWINFEEGHHVTTHAALCVGFDKEKKQPLIAHVTESKGVYGYVRHTLEEMFELEKSKDRALLIFRPSDEALAKKIAEIAGDEESHKELKWVLSTAIKCFFHKKITDSLVVTDVVKDDSLLESKYINPKISRETICSKFVVEAIHAAEAYFFNKGMTIFASLVDSKSPDILPKALEEYLRKAEKEGVVEVKCYPGKNIFRSLQTEIYDELIRINKRTDEKSKEKCEQGLKICAELVFKLDEATHLSVVEKSLALLKEMLPVFKKNTGIGWSVASSYHSLLFSASKCGLFSQYIEKFDMNCISTKNQKEEKQGKKLGS